MAIGALLGGIGQAGLQFLGNWQQNRQNQKLAEDQRNFSREENNRAWQRQQQMFMDTNAYNERMWHKQNQYNEQQLKEAREYDLARWHEQNQYNSPIEQMARMKQAGLSPHLMYGKGTVGQAGAVATSPVTTKAPQASALSAPAPANYSRAQAQNVMAGINAFSHIAQLKNIQAQTNNVDANTANTREETKLKAIELLFREGTLQDRKDAVRFAKLLAKEKALGEHYESAFKKYNYANRLQLAEEQLNTAIIEKNTRKQILALKKWQVSLSKLGITPNDDVFYRMLDSAQLEKADTQTLNMIYAIMGTLATRGPAIGKMVPKKFDPAKNHKQTDVYHWHMK